MSTTIDTKVAQLKFDNSQFEKGVNDSIKDVDKLNKALKFDQASDGLKEVSKTINSLNFNIVTDSLEIVTGKVSKFGEMVTGIFRKAGEDIEQFAVKTVKELSGLNNLAEGYNKYTTILEAENVLVSALSEKGKTLADVEGYVEDLAWFSDETSYNLTHMTDALSKFVNAGADVDQSVGAIQGIASWAAAAGVDASRASSAFYNLSQAMGAGYLGGMDEKSLELLNMMTPQFKEIAISAGIAAGKVEDLGNGLYKAVGGKEAFSVESMKESLKDKWLDTDVLTTALGEYGKYSEGLLEFMKEYPDKYDTAKEAMADYDEQLKKLGKTEEYAISRNAFLMAQQSKTFKDVVEATKDAASTKWYNIIHSVVGDLDEAKEMWSAVCEEVYDIFVGPLDALSDAFKRWHKLGGRKLLIDALGNFYNNAKAIVGTIKEAFSNIFPMDTPLYAKLMNISGTLLKWSQRLKPTEETLNSIRSVIEFILKGIKLIIDAAKAVLVPAKDILGILIDIGKVLLYTIGSAVKRIVGLAKDIVKIIPIHWFKAIWDAIVKIISATRTLVKTMMPQVKGFVGAFRTSFDAVTSGIRKSIKYSKPFGTLLAKIYLKLRSFIDVIKDITKRFQNGDLTGRLSAFGGMLGTMLGLFFNKWWPRVEKAVDWIFNQILKLINFIKKPLPYIREFFGWIIELFGDAAEAIAEFIEETKPIEQIGDLFKAAGEKISGFFEDFDISGKMKTAGERIHDFFASLKKDSAEGGSGGEPDIIDESNKKLETQVTLLDRLSGAWQAFKDAMATAWAFIQEKAIAIGTWLDNATGGAFTKLIEGIQSLFQKLGSGEISIFDVFLKIITAKFAFKQIIALIELIKNPRTVLGSIKEIFGNMADGVAEINGAIVKVVKSFGKTVNAKLLAGTFKSIATAVLELAAALWIMSTIDTEKLGTLFPMVLSFMLGLGKVAKDFLKGTSALADVTGGLSEAKALKSISKTFTNIAKAIIVLVAALWIASKIDEDKAKDGMATIIMLMMALRSMVKQSQKGDIKESGKQIKQIAKAMLVLVAAVFLFGSMDKDRLAQGLLAVISLIYIFRSFITAYNKSAKGATRFDEVGKSFKQMAKAVLILVAAVYLFGSMPLDKLVGGMISVGLLFLAFFGVYAGISWARKKFGGMTQDVWKSITTGFIKMAAALAIIAGGMMLIGIFPADHIYAIGTMFALILLTMAGVYAIIAAVRKNIQGTAPKIFNSLAAGFVILAAAMLVIASAMLMTAIVPTDNVVACGAVFSIILIVMASVYAIIAAMQSSLSTPLKPSHFIAFAAGMVIMANAMLAIAGGILMMGALPLDKMIAAGIIMGGILALMAVLMSLISGGGSEKNKNSKNVSILSGNKLGTGTTLLAMAVAVAAIAGAMALLGDESVDIWKAITGLAAIGGFIVLVSKFSGSIDGAGSALLKLFGGIAIGLIGVGAAIALIAVAAFIFNNSLVALAAGLALFAAGGDKMVKGAEVLGKCLKIIIKDILDALAIAIVEFCKVVVEGFVEICAIVLRGIRNLLVVLNDELPGILDELAITIGIIIAWILDLLPVILDAVGKILEDIMQWLIENIPIWIGGLSVIFAELAVALGEAIIAILNALADWINNNRERIVKAIYNFLGAVIHLLWDCLTKWGEIPEVENAIQSMFAIGDTIFTALGDGMKLAWDTLNSWLGGIPGKIVDFVKEMWDAFTYTPKYTASLDKFFSDTRVGNLFNSRSLNRLYEVLEIVGDDFENDNLRLQAVQDYMKKHEHEYTSDQYSDIMRVKYAYEMFTMKNGELPTAEELASKNYVLGWVQALNMASDYYYNEVNKDLNSLWDNRYSQITSHGAKEEGFFTNINSELADAINADYYTRQNSRGTQSLFNSMITSVRDAENDIVNGVSNATKAGYQVEVVTNNQDIGTITLDLHVKDLAEADSVIEAINRKLQAEINAKTASVNTSSGKQSSGGWRASEGGF